LLDLSKSEINNGFLTWLGDYIKKIKQPWIDGYLCSPIKMELLNQSDQTPQENNILTYFKLENIQNIKLFFTDYLKSNLAIQNQLQNIKHLYPSSVGNVLELQLGSQENIESKYTIKTTNFCRFRTVANRTHFSLGQSYQAKSNLENKLLAVISSRSKILAKLKICA